VKSVEITNCSFWSVIAPNAVSSRLQLPACMLATAVAAAIWQLKPLTIAVEDEAVYAIN
jgi:uncharacterized membrane protein